MEKREITKAMKDAWVQHLLSKFLLITFTDAAAAMLATGMAATGASAKVKEVVG